MNIWYFYLVLKDFFGITAPPELLGEMKNVHKMKVKTLAIENIDEVCHETHLIIRIVNATQGV